MSDAREQGLAFHRNALQLPPDFCVAAFSLSPSLSRLCRISYAFTNKGSYPSLLETRHHLWFGSKHLDEAAPQATELADV